MLSLSLQPDMLQPLDYLPSELAQRITACLEDITTPSFIFNSLLALIELQDPHAGSLSPVPLGEIQRYARNILRVDIPEREIKRAVKLLIEQYGIAIGSARGSAHGYFFVTTADEAELAAEPLLAEIRSLAKRCATLSPRNPYVQHLLGQMEASLGS